MKIQDTAKQTYTEQNDRTYEANAKNYIAADYVGLDIPTGQEFHGLEGYLQAQRNWFAAFPDAKLEVGKQQVTGNKVTTTFRGRGTFTGQMHSPQGEVIPGNGRKVDMECHDELEFKGDKITRGRLNYDMPDMMRQLGIELPKTK